MLSIKQKIELSDAQIIAGDTEFRNISKCEGAIEVLNIMNSSITLKVNIKLRSLNDKYKRIKGKFVFTRGSIYEVNFEEHKKKYNLGFVDNAHYEKSKFEFENKNVGFKPVFLKKNKYQDSYASFIFQLLVKNDFFTKAEE